MIETIFMMLLIGAFLIVFGKWTDKKDDQIKRLEERVAELEDSQWWHT